MPDTANALQTRRRRRDVLLQVAGYVVAAACLVWVFHGIHPGRMVGQLKAIRWQWAAGAIGFDVLSYLCQGLRWKWLLRPSGNMPVLRTTQAIYAGLFTNELVPLRAGELVRAYLVSRWQQQPLMSIVPSMAIERLFDAIWVAIGIGITALAVQLPRDLLHAADAFGAVVLGLTAIFIVLVVREEKSVPGQWLPQAAMLRPIRWILGLVDHIVQGIRAIGVSRYFYFSLLGSALVPACQIVSFWLVMHAYGLHLSLWIGAAVFLILHFGTALPNAPSNIGTYQFFTVLGLTLFGIDKTTATGFSVAAFVILTVPLWVIGLTAIGLTGMRLWDIRREVAALVTRRSNHGAENDK